MKLLINVDAGEKYCGECKKLNRALGVCMEFLIGPNEAFVLYRDDYDFIRLNACLSAAQEYKRLERLAAIIIPGSLSCGYDCHYDERYGFVPEAGCPEHDKSIADKAATDE